MVLAVAVLDFLVDALLDLSLQDTRSLRLVETDDLEDLGSIEPAVGTSPHDGDIVDDALVDGYARVGGLLGAGGRDVSELQDWGSECCSILTLKMVLSPLMMVSAVMVMRRC